MYLYYYNFKYCINLQLILINKNDKQSQNTPVDSLEFKKLNNSQKVIKSNIPNKSELNKINTINNPLKSNLNLDGSSFKNEEKLDNDAITTEFIKKDDSKWRYNKSELLERRKKLLRDKTNMKK